MSAISNRNNPDVILAYIGTGAGSFPAVSLPKRFVLLGAQLIDKAGIAADNTNYVTLTLKKNGSSIGTLDTRAANQGAATALTGLSFAMTTPETDCLVGSALSVTVAVAGTGTTTGAVLQLYGYYR